MLSTTKSVNLSGTSKVNESIVAYLSGSVSETGQPSMNVSITNRDLYKENIDTVKADIDEFQDMLDILI